MGENERLLQERYERNSAIWNKARKFQFPLEKLSDEPTDTLIKAAEHLDAFLSSVLTTEQSHPQTIGLAEKAQNDATLEDAVKLFNNVDCEALTKLNTYLESEKFASLIKAIIVTLEQGGKVFISGCGSSGRLALFLESYFRKAFPDKNYVVAVMAGGDFALVSAIEKFEDKGEYSLRQLEQQAFDPEQDLYLGVSASGSATYNNTAISHIAEKIRAGEISPHLKPWLICCNTAEELKNLKEREFTQSKKTNPDAKSPHPLADYADEMHCLGLDTGPNALAGSSRLQSATITEIALYTALNLALEQFNQEDINSFKIKKNYINDQIKLLIQKLHQNDITEKLALLIKAESGTYSEGKTVLYHCDAKHAIKIFTDLTERGPTFRLANIANKYIPQPKPALYSLAINNTTTPDAALTSMLERDLFSLDWDGTDGKPDEPKTRLQLLNGFDFSAEQDNAYEDALSIELPDSELKIKYFSDNKQKLEVSFDLNGLDDFFKQIFLKIILNTHSTLVMGRLGRYKGNLMTYVNISNAKLFARAIRLITSEVIGRLQAHELPLLSQQFNIPGVSVTPAIQTISLIVAQLVMQEKSAGTINASKEQVGSIVEQATNIYLDSLGFNNLEYLKNLEKIMLHEKKTIDNLIVDETSYFFRQTRASYLTNFFAWRTQISRPVVADTEPNIITIASP